MDSDTRKSFDRHGFCSAPDFVYRSETEELYTAVYTNDEKRKLGLFVDGIPYFINYDDIIYCRPIKETRTAGFGPIGGAIAGYALLGWIGAFIGSQASNLHEEIDEYGIELVLRDNEIQIYLLYKEKVSQRKLAQADEFIGKFKECIDKII